MTQFASATLIEIAPRVSILRKLMGYALVAAMMASWVSVGPVAASGVPAGPEASPAAVAVDDGQLLVDRFDDEPTASACTDAPDDCSLRGAIIQANADSATEEIFVPAGTFTLSAPGTGPTGGDLEVDHSTVITGAGSGLTIVDANHASRAFYLSGGANPSLRFPSLSGMTVRNGDGCAGDNAGDGGGIAVYAVATLTDIVVEDNATCKTGGGIYVGSYGSILTLDRSIVRGNTSNRTDGGHAAGIHADGGLRILDSTIAGNHAAVTFYASTGGIFKGGWDYSGDELEVRGSTISGNTGGKVGGIRADGQSGVVVLTIVDSTISGNAGTAPLPTTTIGGIYAGGPFATITHVTITGNSGSFVGGVRADGQGGVYWNMAYSIVAANSGPTRDCSISTLTLQSPERNVVGIVDTDPSQGDSGQCAVDGPAGALSEPLDVMLGALADNGGPTWTHALGLGSPAIDIGATLTCEPFDQRGVTRPSGPGCDAGAYEFEFIDDVAPATTIESGPADPTAATGATLVFSADEPSTFECSLDLAAFAACVSPLDYTGLADGAHTFAVRATDGAGNVDATPALWGWAVDATAPVTTITFGPANPTPAPTATFEFAADEPSTFECSLDGAAFAYCESPVMYTDLLEGDHEFRARATDGLGNVETTPAAWPWTIDDTADPGPVTLSVADVTVQEGNSGTSAAAIVIRLSAASDAAVSVDVSTANGTATSPADFLAVSGVPVTIGAGELEATITVQIVGDKVRELPEQFTVSLADPVGATITRGQATVTIREPAFGTFHANAIGHDWSNAYLLAVLSHYVYEDNAIAGTLAELSGGTFEDAFAERFNDSPSGLRVVGFIDDLLTQTQGAILETDDAMIVVLRGTELPNGEDGVDLLMDIPLGQVGGVHSGFAAAATAVLPQVRAAALTAQAAGKTVWLTGHSLGGSVATVLALDLELLGIEVQGIYTYGAPRSFSSATSVVVSVLFGSRLQRWVNNLDLVPQLPPPAPLMDYVHAGRVNNIVPGSPTCDVVLSGAERHVGFDFDDHQTSRYLARIFENLPSDALREALPDPSADPASQGAGCMTQPMSALEWAQAAFAAGRDVTYTAERLIWGYGLAAADQLAAVLAAAGYQATQLASVLRVVFHLSVDAVIQILGQLQFQLAAIVTAARDAFWLSARAIAEAMLRQGYGAVELAFALRDVYAFNAQGVAVVLHDAGYAAMDAMQALKEVFLRTPQMAASIMQSVGYGATEIADGLRLLYNRTAAQVLGQLANAGFGATQIAAALGTAFSLQAAQVVTLMKAAAYTATQLAVALRDAFSLQAAQVVAQLKAAAYTATQVGTALKNGLAVQAAQVVTLLKDAAYSVTQVATVLKDVYSRSSAQVVTLLKDAAYAVTQVATVLKNVYSKSASQAINLLQGASYSILEIATALRDAYNRTAAQVATLLDAAGYAIASIVGALVSVFLMTWNAAWALVYQLGLP